MKRYQLKTITTTASDWIRSAGMAIAPVLARIALALPFLRSGLTRWDDFGVLSPATAYLFEEQFKLHIFGAAYGLPWPDTLAYMTGLAEIILPLLLIVGLATRFVSLCLLLMTGVIQLIVPEGWINFHLYWTALAGCIMALGAGRLSLDQFISRQNAGIR